MDGFIVVGNMNAIAYKEIFTYLKDNKMWTGMTHFNDGMYFVVPNDYEYADTYKFEREIDGEKVMRVSTACWFTNLEHNKRKELIGLTKKYNPTDYPKYDNYDAIEVGCYKDIPKDYDGIMGVPITFLDKHNPNQFEILGKAEPCIELEYYKTFPFFKEYKSRQIIHNGRICQKTYHRIFIRKVKEHIQKGIDKEERE